MPAVEAGLVEAQAQRGVAAGREQQPVERLQPFRLAFHDVI